MAISGALRKATARSEGLDHAVRSVRSVRQAAINGGATMRAQSVAPIVGRRTPAIERPLWKNSADVGRIPLARFAAWLGLERTLADTTRTAERCSIERMREAEAYAVENTPQIFSRGVASRKFRTVNEGRVGGWRDSLTESQQMGFAAFAEGLKIMGYPPAQAVTAYDAA